MRELIASAFEFFQPVVEFPAIRARVEFVEENFFPIVAGAALVATFLMWVNI